MLTGSTFACHCESIFHAGKHIVTIFSSRKMHRLQNAHHLCGSDAMGSAAWVQIPISTLEILLQCSHGWRSEIYLTNWVLEGFLVLLSTLGGKAGRVWADLTNSLRTIGRKYMEHSTSRMLHSRYVRILYGISSMDFRCSPESEIAFLGTKLRIRLWNTQITESN